MAHYSVISNIQVQQIPTDAYPDRNLLLSFSFLNKYEGQSTWADLTQTMCITLPKNIRIRAYKITGVPFSPVPNIQSQIIQLGNIEGQDSNLSGFDKTPTFLRGDLIKFNVGYRALVNNGIETYISGNNGVPHLFEGVISGVQPKFPFKIECEDYMWLLKQMPTPAKNWGNISLQDIVSKVMADAQSLPIITRYKGYIDLSVSDFSKTDLKFNVRNFTTTRGSLGSLLARIKSEYRVDSYFRDQKLRIGYLHYDPADSPPPYKTFTFQKNILDGDELIWSRKDDAVLSMIVRSNYLIEEDGTTIDGVAKTKHASTEILIYNNAGTFTYITKKKGEDFPTKYLNDIGERFTFNIYDAISDPAKLFEIGKPQLEKYYYDGFKGSFTTLAIPLVRHGDTINIVDKRLVEKTGTYKVKAVKYMGSTDAGFRQVITLDYRVDK